MPTGTYSKPQMQLQANVPNPRANVNVLDIANAVDAVKNKAYPFSGPCACPSAQPCSPANSAGRTPIVRHRGSASAALVSCLTHVNVARRKTLEPAREIEAVGASAHGLGSLPSVAKARRGGAIAGPVSRIRPSCCG